MNNTVDPCIKNDSYNKNSGDRRNLLNRIVYGANLYNIKMIAIRDYSVFNAFLWEICIKENLLNIISIWNELIPLYKVPLYFHMPCDSCGEEKH